MSMSYFDDLQGYADLEYIEPKTIKEVFSLLSQYKEKAKVIAGGTQLLASMKRKEISPQYLINLKSIPNLEYINYSNGEGLKIGALTTVFEISRSSVVDDKAKILVEAIQQRDPGANRTRWAYYMATLGGYLSNAATSAEVVPALITLGTKAVVEGPKGWKTIPFEDFFTPTGETVLQNNELLVEIRIPKQSADTGSVYLKSHGTTGTYCVAVLLKLDAKHVNIEELKILISGTTINPLEARDAVGIMKGKAIDNDLIEETAKASAKKVTGTSDTEAEERVKELVEEAIRQAVDRAIGDFAMGY